MRTSLAIALLLSATLAAQSPSTAPRAVSAVAFDPAGAAVIDRGLQRYVDADRVPGLVALVMQDGKVVYEKAFGWADKESGRRMTTDAIFRIASQTKALTSVAVMQLVEEGLLTLDTRAATLIPSFAKTTVAVAAENGAVTSVPARRPITVRDLLTHTAGISYGTGRSVAEAYAAKGLGPAAGFGWYTADKNEAVCDTMERLGTLPFAAQPGEAWVYGYNTDVLGCLVEKASGLSLDT
jgi:CubicO group peptidase (beta-lactamase class C family)